MSRVLVGVVTYGGQRYCLDEFLDSLDKQTVKADRLFVVNNGEDAYASLLKSRGQNVVEDPVPSNSRMDKIVNGRRFLRDFALKKEYDYLFFVDSDVILPVNALASLIFHKKDLISGVYLNAFRLAGRTVIAPVLFRDAGGGGANLFTYEGVFPPRLMEIGAAGLGCSLVSREVLKQVDIGVFASGAGEDVKFYVDAREKGFGAWADTSVRCTHRPFPLADKRAVLFEWRRIYEDLSVDVTEEQLRSSFSGGGKR